jgi:hypothetical protein
MKSVMCKYFSVFQRHACKVCCLHEYLISDTENAEGRGDVPLEEKYLWSCVEIYFVLFTDAVSNSIYIKLCLDLRLPYLRSHLNNSHYIFLPNFQSCIRNSNFGLAPCCNAPIVWIVTINLKRKLNSVVNSRKFLTQYIFYFTGIFVMPALHVSA